MSHGPESGRVSSMGVVKRVKMGKKVERALRERVAQNHEEEGEKEPEPYQCNGNFQTDFVELCKQNSMSRPPSVQLRPRRPQSPPHQTLVEVTQHTSTKKGRDDKKQQQQQQQQNEDEESAEEKELIALFGFKPKSFVAKPTSEYMRPCVQVELEQAEKFETVTDIYIRGWQIEKTMLDSFRQCFLTLSKLQSLHFWRTAFTSERIRELSLVLPQCEQIKNLVIDANEPLDDENYHELIKENSHLTKLQLRFCSLSPVGCSRLANVLGNTKQVNSKLISLDLSCNKVGDEGASSIAKALRTNRTLLHLSLSSNGVTDEGCLNIAQSVSQFVLTHEEIVSRRYLQSEKESLDRPKSVSTGRRRSSMAAFDSLRRGSLLQQPPLSRRDHKEQRPGSVRSQEKGRSSRGEKKTKGRDAKEEKAEKGKGKRDEKSSGKKEEGAGRRLSVHQNIPIGQLSTRRMSGTASEAAKSSVKSKAKGGKAGKSSAQLEVAEPSTESSESRNPLLERVETIAPGQLQIAGNFVLILLNLSRNKISERGFEALLRAVNFQTTYLTQNKANGTGLMKILLKGNSMAEDAPISKQLEEAMLLKDPFYKAPPKTPDTDSHIS